MNREEFIAHVGKTRPFLFDGATGSNLMKAGMPRGVCTEKWVLENPQAILNLQRAYVEAGSQAVYAPTFSGNRISLGPLCEGNLLEQINTELPGLSKKAVEGKALVAGDLTTVGQFLDPVGDLEEEELFDAYKEQAEYLIKAGVDFIIGETLLYAEEAFVMVDAVRSISDIAICITFTVDSKGNTPFGTRVVPTAEKLQEMGVAAVGINCSMGPDQAQDVVRMLKERITIPVIAKMNAGIPEVDSNGTAVYGMDPVQFSGHVEKLLDLGADIVGGCCGTDPSYIKVLHDLIEKRKEK